MKTILFITSLSGPRLTNFVKSSINASRILGLEFHIASNQNGALSNYFSDCAELGVIPHHIDFKRNPYNPKNIKAYLQIRKLMVEQKFDIIHCNTPVGGVIGRLLSKHTKSVIYMAHGFHFWSGAPIKNWILYYLPELILSKRTDILVTMNNEDYDRSANFKARDRRFIHGVGINTNVKIENKDNKYIKEFNLQDNDFVIFTAGELSKRKNQIVIIKAIQQVQRHDVKVLIAGKGKYKTYLEKYIKKFKLEDKVKLIGFRTDVANLLAFSDLFIFPSKQEGMPLALLEAMAQGKAVLASDIRGHRDLFIDKKEYLFKFNDINKLSEKIINMINNKKLLSEIGYDNMIQSKQYDVTISTNEIMNIYYDAFKISDEKKGN